MTPAEFTAQRKQIGLTQAGLAARLGLTARAIQHYEGGTLALDAIAARAFRLCCASLRAAELRGWGRCDGAPVSAGPRQDAAAEPLEGGLRAKVGSSGRRYPRDGEGHSETRTTSEG